MEEETNFVNMDTWKGSANYGLTFSQIVIQHINRCVLNGSVEFCGGYWKEQVSGNQTNRVYVPNSREVYCNSVKMLRALLLGYFDGIMEREDKKLKEEYDLEYEKYSKIKEKNNEKDSKSEWYNYKIEWHLKLFEQLILLAKRLNFFEEVSVDIGA